MYNDTARVERKRSSKMPGTTPEHDKRANKPVASSPSTRSLLEVNISYSFIHCLYRCTRMSPYPPSVIPFPVIVPSFSSAHPGTGNQDLGNRSKRNQNRTETNGTERSRLEIKGIPKGNPIEPGTRD